MINRTILTLLIRFVRVYSNVSDFYIRKQCLTAKMLKQGYRYHTIRKAFSKFYHRHSDYYIQYWFKISSATGNIRASIYETW